MSGRRHHKVPPARGRWVEPQPTCADCGQKAQRNEAREWFCLRCFDSWLRETINNKAGDHTASGIQLPAGVKDPAKANPSYRDVYSNRRARRLAARRA